MEVAAVYEKFWRWLLWLKSGNEIFKWLFFENRKCWLLLGIWGFSRSLAPPIECLTRHLKTLQFLKKSFFFMIKMRFPFLNWYCCQIIFKKNKRLKKKTHLHHPFSNDSSNSRCDFTMWIVIKIYSWMCFLWFQ